MARNTLRPGFVINPMKYLLSLCLLCCLSVSVQSRTYTDVVDSGYISIAVYRDFPPYSYMNNGSPAGIDIEVGAQIAQRLGLKPQWFWLTADENLDDDLRNAVWKGHYLGGGVADVMMRVPYDKDYENDKVAILAPYHTERWTIARDTENLPELINLAPFQYHKVGVEIDSLPDLKLTSIFGGRLVDQVIHYRSTLEAMDALKNRKIDAVAGMRGQIEWRLMSSETYSAQASPIKISDESLVSWPRRNWDIAIAVKSSHKELGKAVAEKITNMVDGGEMKEIFEEFRLSYEPPQ